jgi:hydroxyacylglutathione hydrolase
VAFALQANHTEKLFSDVFVGDSVFGAGCGGLFEGTHEQMLQGIGRIKALDAKTRLWCAHEYTIKNLRVARLLNEDNAQQMRRLAQLETQLQAHQLEPHQWITLPLTVDEECSTNPFFRCDSASLQKTIDTTGELETFKKVRAFRDQF